MKKKLKLPKQRTFQAPANILKRALAFFFDLMIISFIIYPLESVLRNFIPENASYSEAFAIINNPELIPIITTISIMISIIAVIYFTILEYKFQQTLGKMIAKIYVVSDNKKLLFWQCLVRNLFLLPFIPFILLWVIDPIYILFTKENKRFSDMLAKTNVIENYLM